MVGDARRIVRDDGTVVLSLRGGWSPQAMKEIAAGKFDELSINTGEWGDFERLVPFANQIMRLSVTSPVDTLKGIESLKNLVGLELDGAPNPPLDILKLQKLQVCYLKWHKKYPKEFFAIPSLRDVTLVSYSEKDCKGVSLASRLSSLDLRQGSVQSLEGLESLSNLRALSLSYLKNLHEVLPIAGLSMLEALHIEKCPKVLDVSFVPRLTRLKELFLDCGGAGFDDLRWLSKFTNLTDLLIAVPVKSPNWDVIFSLRELRDVVVNTHTGYKIKDEEIFTEARKAGRDIGNFTRAGTKEVPAFKFRMAPSKVH